MADYRNTTCILKHACPQCRSPRGEHCRDAGGRGKHACYLRLELVALAMTYTGEEFARRAAAVYLAAAGAVVAPPTP
jgi:hypothetical protein